MSNSKIYLGSTNLGTGKIRLGANDVSAIYLGASLLYPPTTPPTPTGDYLCFTANAANCTVGMTNNGSNQPVMYYSTDQTNWTLWDYSNITLANIGDKVYFYGNNPNGFSTSLNDYSKFTTSGSVAVTGNIMTLISSDGSTTIIPSSYCFYYLFKETTITTAPTLPATTLTNFCYAYMFIRCHSLTTAPALPATTLANSCYSDMFEDCTSLTTAPALPATTLGNICYNNMFFNCTSLTTAPELPATTLRINCYNGMFRFCSSLQYVKVGAIAWNPSYALNWMQNVASTGTFVKPSSLVIGTGSGEIPSDSASGIPTGWTVIDNSPDINEVLCFTATTAPASFTLDNSANTINPVIYYSTDNGTNWTQWDYSTITLQNVGDKVYFYGDNPNGFSVGNGAYAQFSTNGNSTGRIAASGDIMSLIHYSCPTTVPNAGCFYKLFKNFTELTTAPSIGATTLTQSCFLQMFSGCSHLTTAPQLNATTVPAYAYQQMFEACSGLLQAPALPATTIGNYAYSMMFWQCTQITTAPDLMVQTLPEGAYNNMFNGCSNLSSVKCMATDISASMCTNNWLLNVAATGTFTKSPDMSSWTTGGSGIPSGWTVDDYYDCTDCNNYAECGYESYEDCDCQVNGNCQEGVDCDDWENLGYESYEDCDCQENGECPEACQDCIGSCEGDSECEEACYECDEPCGEPCDPCADVDLGDCNYWDCFGYESYEDCQCQQYSECPEPVDCSDWENMGYESYEDCDCSENGNCPEEEEPEE